MRARLLWIGLLVCAAARAGAADMPFGVLDIGLGASYARLERELDFRDVNESLAKQAGKPDLGKRGYGCMQREDDFADVGCVSHVERLDGIETREIRLHFLDGRLQQFSVSAEVQNFDAVVGYLRTRFGAPQSLPAKNAGDQPGVKWQNEGGQIVAYRGRDLVFVTFELVSYPDAVKRKHDGQRLQCG
ncbi:MAG TPA: hypothetical protein VGO84_01220 [Burkholderiales bacterium]|jgi:hypothetical protein|nr:hypothetical protein [Burkholderiales bacterium]